MKIQILGSGCANCGALEANAREAAVRLELAVEVEKVSDSDEILEMGVLRTPGIAFDGVVQKSGSVLSVDEISGLLQAYRS